MGNLGPGLDPAVGPEQRDPLGIEDAAGVAGADPGAAADLLVVDGRPDTDIGAVRRTRMVMAAGRLVDLGRLRDDATRALSAQAV